MEYAISEVARLSGTTSRTLRHYGDVGLLPATRTAANGYRYYDGDALVTLQRILLLRDLGLGLPAIAQVLDGQRDHSEALLGHLGWLRQEKARLDRQIASVEDTILRREGGGSLMADEMFDGFDHTRYQAEVVERWGAESSRAADTWWRTKSPTEKTAWMQRQKSLGADWIAAAEAGHPTDGPIAQALAARHYDWLTGIPGAPATDEGLPTKEYVVGLAEMYVADARFAANYGGTEGARFVRDALVAFAERTL